LTGVVEADTNPAASTSSTAASQSNPFARRSGRTRLAVIPSALTCSLCEGDRVLFSVDYPLEDSDEAARFIETAPLSEIEREAVCFRNAERMLRL